MRPFFAMDAFTETFFLSLIDEQKEILLSKQNTTSMKARKNVCWEEVRRELTTRTGKDFSAQQLQKRWSNIQARVKEKKSYQKGTGGGPVEKFTENDMQAFNIIGAGNPKLAMVPGAMSNTDSLRPMMDSPSSSSSLTQEPVQKKQRFSSMSSSTGTSRESSKFQVPSLTSQSSTCSDSKEKTRESFDDLHKSVLLLQREKLKLKLELLRRQVSEKRDAATQTDGYYSNMSFMQLLTDH